MLNIRNLRIDPASLGKEMLLVDIAPRYEYREGRRTDNLTGYSYVVALPAHGLEKISVRIDGKRLMEKPEGYVEVTFAGLELNAYEREGRIQFSGVATGIALAKKG